MSALAATLREADPGTKIWLVLRDGAVVGGTLRSVNGESVDLDEDGGTRVDLREVQRLRLEFSSVPGGTARKQAA